MPNPTGLRESGVPDPTGLRELGVQNPTGLRELGVQNPTDRPRHAVRRVAATAPSGPLVAICTAVGLGALRVTTP